MNNPVVLYQKTFTYRRRKAKDLFMGAMLGMSAGLALIPLISVSQYVLSKGWPGLNLEFFTSLPQPVGEAGGGMANALAGTAILILLASGIGIPWGIAMGLYLSEYGSGRLASLIRFCTDILASVPSIVVGLFVYAVMVMPMGRFSAYAGGVALAILMIPTIARSTEELLRMVPIHYREAGLALGLPRWKTTLFLILSGSKKAIVTSIMLAIARVAGETAPLLFTAFGNRIWHEGLDQPIASLPVQIYTYAISPYDSWHQQAWAGALVLVMFVFILNIVTRFFLGAFLRGGSK